MRFTRILLLASLLALVVTPVALAIRFTDASYQPPVGETGKFYVHHFGGAAGCGPALPYQFRILDGGVPGLTLHKDGTYDGKPTTVGDFTVWVELSDENPPSQSWCRPAVAQRDFHFHIIRGLVIKETASNSLGVATLNTSYSKQLTTDGAGASPLTWSVSTGSLPPGLALNNGTGQISGTPTQTGDWTFKIKVTDGTRSDIQTYTLPVVEPLKITSALRATGLPGKPFTFQLSASGGRTPYKWTAEGLPAGLTLDQNTGAITGTVATPGSASVKVTLTDALGEQQTANLTIALGAKLAIAGVPLPTLKVGKKYRARVIATGGIAPRTWAIIGGRPGTLPPGIKFGLRTGIFSGTPTKAGTWRLRLQVTDGAGSHLAVPVILKVLK